MTQAELAIAVAESSLGEREAKRKEGEVSPHTAAAREAYMAYLAAWRVRENAMNDYEFARASGFPSDGK